MKQCLVPVWVLLLLGLFPLFCTSSAIADSHQKIEYEANLSTEMNLPSGWINFISSDEVIIDDTHYRFSGKTRFSNKKSVFQEGVFVEFELGEDNVVVTMHRTEPTEQDMYMKPIIRSKSKTASEKVDKRQDGPRLENGIWIN